VYEALSSALAPILGGSGFRAIFARSVKLTAADYPLLGTIPTPVAPAPQADPVLTHVLDSLAKLEPDTASELAANIYASFYSLMTKMIGEALVEQIVRGAFPTIGESALEGRD
jgi:hypothetical protein